MLHLDTTKHLLSRLSLLHIACCRSCGLEKDSLEPLAQLSSLKTLALKVSSEGQLQPLQKLLSSAVQGCLLRVELCDDTSVHMVQQVRAVREAVVEEKGSRNVPGLMVRKPWWRR
jgi:hypothetical protein